MTYTPREPDPVVKEACDAVGGAAELARRLTAVSGKPITRSAISQWLQIPHLRVLQVEKITGISRHKQRPDLYPRERKKRGARR